VKITTIEQLNSYWINKEKKQFEVTFGPPEW
jgi:hypothetical protein